MHRERKPQKFAKLVVKVNMRHGTRGTPWLACSSIRIQPAPTAHVGCRPLEQRGRHEICTYKTRNSMKCGQPVVPEDIPTILDAIRVHSKNNTVIETLEIEVIRADDVYQHLLHVATT